MFSWLNRKIGKYFKKRWKSRVHTSLLDPVLEFFRVNGDGIYYNVMRSSNKNLVSRAIRLFAGKETHSVIMLYAEDLKSKFSSEEWDLLRAKYIIYYGPVGGLNEDNVKILVLASADDNGMNYFDFSKYQLREQSVRKAPVTAEQESVILRYLCSPEVMDAEYDYVGLTFWWFFRLIDDEKAFFCSEIVSDAFKKVYMKVSEDDNPSPHNIEEYNTDPLWLKKPMGLGWPVAK